MFNPVETELQEYKRVQERQIGSCSCLSLLTKSNGGKLARISNRLLLLPLSLEHKSNGEKIARISNWLMLLPLTVSIDHKSMWGKLARMSNWLSQCFSLNYGEGYPK
jgi:hypothetical protein